jgi:hypothetical protein
MKISFSCLGFKSSEVFLVTDEGNYCCVGYIDKFDKTYEFTPLDNVNLNSEEIVKEYEKQFKERGVWMNNGIVYAG